MKIDPWMFLKMIFTLNNFKIFSVLFLAIIFCIILSGLVNRTFGRIKSKRLKTSTLIMIEAIIVILIGFILMLNR
jgi:uncharacterized membrane protein HdeD (DUF308 family)